MLGPNSVPDIVIGRLPIYLRALSRLAQEGREITSSHELGEKLGISSAQIRKDLSHFGTFGKQGTGYRIADLENRLRQILHIDREWEVALVGAGDLGHALGRYNGFRDRGFEITAIFDRDPAKIGQKIGHLQVLDVSRLREVIQQRNIRLAMIAVPASEAQDVADDLVEAGVQAILNYAPITLSVPPDIHVQYIDPVVHLQRMTYYLE